VLGRLFKEFAITICVAILISGVVSVTLTPMLCSRFLRSAHEEKRSWFYRATERFFQGMLHVYDVSLTWVLRYRPVTMGVSAVVLAATLYMFVTIPKGFIPDQDTDQMQVYTEASQGTSYYQMVDYEQKIADLVSKDANVDSLMASVGGTTASNLGGPNYGELVVHLKPRSRRRLGVNDIIKELRPKLAGLAGMKSYLQNPPTIQIGGQVTKSLYQFSMQTPDKPELYAQTDKLLKQVEQVPGVEDVASDVAVQTPQAFPRAMLETAHQRAKSDGTAAATDDATLCERLGHPVRVVAGSPWNIKITTPEDFALAEALAAAEERA